MTWPRKIAVITGTVFLSLHAMCHSAVKGAIYVPEKSLDRIASKIVTCFNSHKVKIEKIKKLSPDELKNFKVLILWGTKYNPKSKISDNDIDRKTAKIIQNWVKNGGGLLCFHNAVGFSRKGGVSIFPEAGEGIDNVYPDSKAYARESIVTTVHPVTEGMAVSDRFVCSYFDNISIKPGAKGIPLARRVVSFGNKKIVGDPVIVAAEIGKGRYVASGFATGLHANGFAVEPLGSEKGFLLNAVNWLAKETNTPVTETTEQITKGALLEKTNLVKNPSAEKVTMTRNGKMLPLGWSQFLGAGEFEYGATDKEKRSGKYSVYLKAKKYYTHNKRGKLLGAAILTGKVTGYYSKNPKVSCAVKPNTVYKFSFWLKTAAPYFQVKCFAFGDNGVRKVLNTSLGWGVYPKDDKWHKYDGQFTTDPQTEKAVLGIFLSGKEKRWGRNPAIPLESVIYVDDVNITESGQVSVIKDLRKRFCVSKKVKWEKNTGKLPELDTVIPFETPLKFNQAYLDLPYYSNLPEGWQRIDLKGLWKIKKLRNAKEQHKNDSWWRSWQGVPKPSQAQPVDGIAAGYWKKDFPDQDWALRHVPSGWYTDDTPETSEFSGIRGRWGAAKWLAEQLFPWDGWYRRNFTMPPLNKGQRVLLRFDGSCLKTAVWVNGKKIGRHTGGWTAFYFDITDAVITGKNSLAVNVYDPFFAYEGHYSHGGLWNRVYIDIAPEIYAHRILITPKFETSEIKVDAWLKNMTGKKQTADIKAVVKSYLTPLSKGAKYDKTTSLKKLVLLPDLNRFHFKIKIDNPVYWSPGNPFLYTLEFKIGDKYISRDRFGYREFIAQGPLFLLNKKPVFLNGQTYNFYGHTYRPDLIDSTHKHFLFTKKCLLAMKTLNVNNLYGMITFHPRAIYDLCDEIGLTVYTDWMNPRTDAFPSNRKIETEDIREMDAWVYQAYNHPSQIMWSLGAELYDAGIPKHVSSWDEALNPLYERVKKIDQQDRPVCQSSGRKPSNDKSKTDMWDFHTYPGAISGSWTEEWNVIDSNKEKMQTIFGQKEIPLIQYEIGGFRRQPINSDARICHRAGFKVNNDWDKAAFIRIATSEPVFKSGLRTISALYSWRRMLSKNSANIQKTTVKGLLGMARCNGFLDGLAINCDLFDFFDALDKDKKVFRGRANIHSRAKGDFKKKIFVPAEAYIDLKRMYSPALICLPLWPKNCFAGKTYETIIYVANNTGNKVENLKARVVLKDSKGKIISDTSATLGKLLNYRVLSFNYSGNLPADLGTGDYKTELFLYENNKKIAENEYDFWVLSSGELTDRISTSKKVALYDKGEKLVGKNGLTTQKIFKQLKIPHTKIADFNDLDKYQVLIIGAHSFNPELNKAGDKIRKWLKKGGRLLTFEQSLPGHIAYLPKMQVVKNYPNILSEIITPSHPVFKGLTPENFFRWNGNLPDIGNRCPGAVFQAAIKPLNKTLVAVGGVDVPRNTTEALGMTLADIKVGNGVVVLNQLEATCRYGKDSAATKYMQNLLKYIFSDETGYSTPLEAFSTGKVDKYMCGLVDIGKGKRKQLGEVFFNLADKGIILKGSTVKTINIAKNVFFDPAYEKRYEKIHTDEGGLQHDYIEKIYILHSYDKAESKGKCIGNYRLLYADNSSYPVNIVWGSNIANPAFKGTLPFGLKIKSGFCITAFDNPFPGKKIKGLEIVCGGSGTLRISGITCKLIRQRLHH